MSCEEDCRCYLCRELVGFLPSKSGAMLSRTDNFILMRPISAENILAHTAMKPRAVTGNKQTKPVQRKESQQSNMQGDRSFALRIPDIKMSVIGYWKNKDVATKKTEGKDKTNICWSPLYKSDGKKSNNKIQGSEAARLGVKLWKSSELLCNISGQNVRIENSKLVNDVTTIDGWVAETREELADVKSGRKGSVVVVMTNKKDHSAQTQKTCWASQDKVKRSSIEEVCEVATEGYEFMWYVASFPSSCPFVSGHHQIRCIILLFNVAITGGAL